MINFFRQRYAIFILLILALAGILTTYQDFGIGWDENTVYRWGEAYFYHYIGRPIPNGEDVLQGQIVEYSNIYAAVVFGISYVVLHNTSMESFHLINLLFILPFLFIVFEVLYRKYRNQWLALMGPIFLIFIPRFIGDVAVNSKDIPFAMVYLVALFGIYIAPRIKESAIRILLLAVLFSLAQNFRLVGFTIYLLYVAYLVYVYWLEKHEFKWAELKVFVWKNFLELILISLVAMFLMVLTWPAIGYNFLAGMYDVIKVAKSFPWVGNILFAGHDVVSNNLPLTYLPGWLVLTTPLFILGLMVGSFWIVKRWKHNRLFVLMWITVAINLVLYYILKPVIYDGLRHYLFLLPVFGFIAAMTFIELWQQIDWHLVRQNMFKVGVVLLVFINLAIVGYHLVALHPYQYSYFNELVGGLPGAYLSYETDYWGVSYREAVIWLEKNEVNPDQKYKINGCSNDFQVSYYLVDNMIWVADPGDADYIVCITRWEGPINLKNRFGDKLQQIHIIEREGTPLNFIYRLTH